MNIAAASGITAIIMAFALPSDTALACDDLVDTIIAKHLGPVIENADCPLNGLDKKGHRLVGVCYESAGATSHIDIDTQLNCHASDESVVSHLLGSKSTPSVSENVTVEAEVRGADCQLVSVDVKPSGELGKMIAAMFDAKGEARKALERGLAEMCKK
jgi:hypothetical protein